MVGDAVHTLHQILNRSWRLLPSRAIIPVCANRSCSRGWKILPLRIATRRNESCVRIAARPTRYPLKTMVEEQKPLFILRAVIVRQRLIEARTGDAGGLSAPRTAGRGPSENHGRGAETAFHLRVSVSGSVALQNRPPAVNGRVCRQSNERCR
jgi:hypothetical protein